MVNGSFEHESIVDGDVTYSRLNDISSSRVAHSLQEIGRDDHSKTYLTVPTWLTSAGDALVHDVVGDEEISLELRGISSDLDFL